MQFCHRSGVWGRWAHAVPCPPSCMKGNCWASHARGVTSPILRIELVSRLGELWKQDSHCRWCNIAAQIHGCERCQWTANVWSHCHRNLVGHARGETHAQTMSITKHSDRAKKWRSGFEMKFSLEVDDALGHQPIHTLRNFSLVYLQRSGFGKGIYEQVAIRREERSIASASM